MPKLYSLRIIALKAVKSQAQMTKTTKPHLTMERVTALSMLIIFATSGLALLGWIINRPILASIQPEFIPMAPSTALLFLGLSSIEVVFRMSQRNQKVRSLVQASLLGSLIIIFILALNTFTGLGPDIEQMFVSQPAFLGDIQTAHISPLTALGFLLIIPALFLQTIYETSPRLKSISAALSFSMIILSGIILLGYLYGLPLFYGGALIPVAATTAISFLFLSLVSLIHAGSSCWPSNQFIGPSLRARMIRAFIPASIVIALLQGFFSTAADFWIVNPVVRIAASTLIACLVFILIITQIAHNLSSEIDRGNQARMAAEHTLQQSEARFRTLAETANDAIINIDQDGQIVFWNHASETIFGYTAEEVREKSLGFIIPAEFLRAHHNGMKRIVATGESHIIGKTVEIVGRRKDGSEFPLALSLATWQIDGKVFFTGIGRDISERKKTEEKLRAVSYRQQVLLSAIPDIIMEVDSNKVYTWANQHGLAFFGEDVVGQEASSFSTNERDLYAEVDPIFEGKEDTLYIEDWQWRKDGEKRLLAWWCQALKDEKGRVTGVLSSARDITERQQAGEALRESEERYRSLYENIPIGIYRTSPDGKILMANPTLVRMLGFSTFEELSQRNLASPGYESNYPRQEFMETIERAGEVIGLESTWKRKDGSTIFVRESARLVKGKENPFYYEGIVEDISIQKTAEAALRQSELSLQSVLKSTADGILAIGKENEVLYVNERFTELWRIPPAVMSSKDDGVLLRHVLDQLADPQGFLKKVQELYLSKVEIFDTLTFKDGRIFERSSRPLIQGIEVMGRVWSFRDITERKQIEDRLERERILLRTLIDTIPDRIYVMDAHGRKILSNAADLSASGGETYPPELANEYWSTAKDVIETGVSIINREEPGVDFRGKPVWVLSSKVPLKDGQGKIEGLVGVGRDITDRKQAEKLKDAIYRIAQAADQAESLDSLFSSIHAIIREVMIAENFFFALYDETNDSISFPYFIDPYDEKPTGPTPTRGLTGYVIRSKHSLLITRNQLSQRILQGELEVIGHTGEDWLGVPLRIDERIIGVMATQSYSPESHFTQSDLELLEFVSTQVAQAIERKRLEEEIRSLSLTDELTGLYNRRGFTWLAEREFIAARRMNRSMLLFFGDMDNLKMINDTWGHAQGDWALKEIAKIFKENFRESDILARIGGDEFVILAVDSAQESAETMANRIQTCLKMRNRKGDTSCQLSISLGISCFNPDIPSSLSEMMAEADRLMYQQKQAKKVTAQAETLKRA